MALINRIEVANMANEIGQLQWGPKLAYNRFDLRGRSTIISMENGAGKSTITDALLGLLSRDHSLINKTHNKKMAPNSFKYYSHFRIEAIDRRGHRQEDMIEKIGGDIPGNKYVFGMYGNSGANSNIYYYYYEGILEDCPIIDGDDRCWTYISKQIFREQLKSSNKIEKNLSKDDWLERVGKHFDMADINQMAEYQKAGAGESVESIYKVNRRHGDSFTEAFFYTHLAPKLLVKLMGGEGDADEYGVEHTICKSTENITEAMKKFKREKEQTQKIQNKIDILKEVLAAAIDLSDEQRKYDDLRKEIYGNVQVLKNLAIDNPVPGIPSAKLPQDERIAAIAASLALQEGQWYIPDRMLAKICDEEVNLTNQRADNEHIKSVEARRSEVIENPCDTAPQCRDIRGIPNKLYTNNDGIQLISLSTRFKQGWTKETATSALKEAFKWAETADTNFVRAKINNLLKEKEAYEESISEKKTLISEEKNRQENLKKEYDDLREAGEIYEKMRDSGLFTDDELADPKKTREKVNKEVSAAEGNLEQYVVMLNKHKEGEKHWIAFKERYGEDAIPEAIEQEINTSYKKAEQAAKEAEALCDSLNENLRNKVGEASERKDQLNDISIKTNQINTHKESFAEFKKIFGDIPTENLVEEVKQKLNEAASKKIEITKKIESMREGVNAITVFRDKVRDKSPIEWVTKMDSEYKRLIAEQRKIQQKLEDFKRRRDELNTAQVASGKVYSHALETLSSSGYAMRPLHEAIASFNLTDERKRQSLTLFSALLFAPVFESIQTAAEGAKKLFKEMIEVPVFVEHELRDFCQQGEITEIEGMTHTYLVGTRTCPVDCLLNPSLVEDEKAEIDIKINHTEDILKKIEAQIEETSPDNPFMRVARKAEEAVAKNYEEENAKANAELTLIEELMPDLHKRHNAIHLIHAAEHFNRLGGYEAYDALVLEHEKISDVIHRIQEEIDTIERDLPVARERKATATNILMEIFKSHSQESQAIEKVKMFLNEGGSEFIATAVETEKKLNAAKNSALQRKMYDFTAASIFVEKGESARLNEVLRQIENIEGKIDELQDNINKANELVRKIQDQMISLNTESSKVDRMAAMLVRKFKKAYRALSTLREVPTNVLDSPFAEQVKSARGALHLAVEMNEKLSAIDKIENAVTELHVDHYEKELPQAKSR
jgi:hypothetical protein